MAYIKKTWKNRQSEYPNRRKLVSVGPDTYDVAREEGLVFDEGDAFNQANMNDLEARIEQGFEQEGVKTLTHTKTGTVHTPGNLPTAPGLYTANLTPTADYAEGDTWADGWTAELQGSGEPLPNEAFKAGKSVAILVDTVGKKLGFKMGGGGQPKPPTEWTFLQAFTANGTFLMEKGLWYRVHVFGKCGKGGNNTFTTGSLASNSGSAGAGSGGYSCSVFYLKDNDEIINITIDNGISSFGSHLSATSGADAENLTTYRASYNSLGGIGGEAMGGNVINMPGYRGGRGGKNGNKTAEAGENGANNGALGGSGGSYSSSAGNLYSGGGGGGGARLPDSPYTIGNLYGYKGGDGCRRNADRTTSAATSGDSYPNDGGVPILFGGGNGAGGKFVDDGGVFGSLGTPAIIIIEVGA